MFDTLAKDLVQVSVVFKDTEFDSITEEEFEMFLKDAVFEKLKGKKLGEVFAEKFGVQDRVLSIFSDDKDIIQHIRYCKYVK
jgi:predicted transcriptional regulator